MTFSCLESCVGEVNWQAGDIYSFFTTPQSEWQNREITALNPEECGLVADQCYSDARWERFKSVMAVAGGLAASFLMAALAGAALDFALAVILATILPYVSVITVFLVVSVVTMTASSMIIGYLSVANILKAWKNIFAPAAINCWNHANQLIEQARAAELRQAASV
jgi:hypothetical protein